MTSISDTIRTVLPGGRWFRRYALATLPQYWRLRQAWSRAVFGAWKRIYGAREGTSRRLEAGALFWQLITAVLWPALRAVLVVIAVGVAEWLLLQKAEFIGRLISLQAPDPSLYVAFTETVAQTVGAFLGLYLAALSVVVSTSYANVPSDVRSLLITEPASGVFLRSLAFTTAAAVVMLGAQTMGWNPGTANFWLLVVLSLLSVFGVVQLGLGVLTLFDPAAHTHRLARTVLNAAQSATIHGFRYNDPSFQANYQRIADQAVITFGRVIDVAVERGTSSRPSVIRTANSALMMLRVYVGSKPDIPQDSRWFKRVGRHPSWFRASHSAVEMAERTGTFLQPELVGDEFWLEGSAIGMASRVTAALVDRGDCGGVAEIASVAEKVVEDLAGEFRFEDALRVHKAFVPLGSRVARLPPQNSHEPNISLYQLGAVDALYRNLTAVLIAGASAIAALTPEKIAVLARRVMRQPERHVGGAALPHAVNQELATLRRCLSFEVRVEGRVLTPAWFVEHVLGAAYAQAISEFCTTLLGEVEDLFPQEVKALMAENAAIAVLVAQLGLEWCDKFERHFLRIARVRSELCVLERVAAAQPWPALEEKEARERSERLRDELLQGLAQAAPTLPSTQPSGEIPDLFGYAYTTLSRECYMALAEGKHALFRSLFGPYFYIALLAYTRVGEELRTFPQETQLAVSADVIADLAEICGYALIWSELDGGDAWYVAKGIWDSYLDCHQDSKKAAAFVVAMLDFRYSVFRTSTGDLRRISWHQDFKRKMGERGLYGGILREDVIGAEPVSHLARAAIRHGVMSGFAADAFLVEYLLKRPEGAGFTPTPQMQRWIDAVELELRRVRERRPPDRRFWG